MEKRPRPKLEPVPALSDASPPAPAEPRARWREGTVVVRFDAAEMRRLDDYRRTVDFGGGAVLKMSRTAVARLLVLRGLPPPPPPGLIPLPGPQCPRNARCDLQPGHAGICGGVDGDV